MIREIDFIDLPKTKDKFDKKKVWKRDGTTLTFSQGVGLICANTRAKLCTAHSKENLLLIVMLLHALQIN